MFFLSLESLKRDLKQLKLLPPRPGRSETQFTGVIPRKSHGYSVQAKALSLSEVAKNTQRLIKI